MKTEEGKRFNGTDAFFFCERIMVEWLTRLFKPNGKKGFWFEEYQAKCLLIGEVGQK